MTTADSTPAPVAHTPGPWGIEATDHTLWVGPMRDDGWKVSAVVVSLPTGDDYRRQYQSQQMTNARLIVASANSYMKHCADPIAAAEGDLLGDCLDLLKRVSQGASHTKVFLSSREKMHPAGIDLFDEEMSEARAILSCAGKLKGADHD